MSQVVEQLSIPKPIPQGSVTVREYLTTPEFILASAVLLFGAVVLGLLFAFLRKREATADDVLRTVSVTLIIIGSLFCMTAGFNDQQIAPIIGLFGTIIGYVVGKRSSDSGGKAKQSRPSSSPENTSDQESSR